MTTAADDDQPDSRWADALTSLPTTAQQLSFLQNEYADPAEGLFSLLDEATQRMRGDPSQARRLAAVVAELAAQLEIAEILPRAAYIQAQTHALAGEFDRALAFIESAHDGYEALGQHAAAMRTTAGLIHVLGELGRYDEALAAGRAVLDEIGPRPPADSPLAPVAALMYQNMAVCYRLSGRFDETLAAHDAAEALFLDMEMTAQAADVSNNRGVLLWALGRGTEALAAFEQVREARAAGNQTQLHAQSLTNVGSAHLLLGNYTAALDSFEQARRLFNSIDHTVDRQGLLLDTAGAYLSLNLYPEALAAFNEANDQLQSIGVVHERVRALWGMGSALLALGQPDEAEQVLSEAVRLLVGSSSAPAPLLVSLLLEQSAVQVAKRHEVHATATAEQALAIAHNHNWPMQEIYACLQLADLTHADPTQMEAHLSAAQRLAEPIGIPHFRYRLYHRFGRLRRLQGRDEEAQHHLQMAIAEVEQLRGALLQETIRTSFLQDKAAVYHDLIRLHLDRGDATGQRCAFETAEQARSRALLDLISGVRTPAPNPGLADVDDITRLNQLQADLNAVYNQLLSGGSEAGGELTQENEVRPDTLHARAIQLENHISRLRVRLTTSGRIDPWASPMTLPEVQAHLPDDMTLVAYQALEDEIVAFVVDRRSLRVVRDLERLSEVQPMVRRLTGMLDRLRAGEALNSRIIAALEMSVRRVLAKLHDALFAPLSLLPGATADAPRKVVIIPHAILHHIPFHALHDGYRYLLDRYEISYAPSATIYTVCQSRALNVPEAPLLLGVPDVTIPGVTTEVRDISHRLPTGRLLLDGEATREALKSAAPGCSLLHLACHGLFRADNPMFSALKLDDGWLMAGEIAELQLSDALVTLSACESGRSQVVGGDELLGLLRAFLGAGAATVIVSLWLAQDDTTARLMDDMYSELLDQGTDPAAALRAAQLSLKAEHPHPYYWAPFIVVGHR
jgi:CHAT domain-containing protein/tetratricopeptide (TPR) repeat protein